MKKEIKKIQCWYFVEEPFVNRNCLFDSICSLITTMKKKAFELATLKLYVANYRASKVFILAQKMMPLYNATGAIGSKILVTL